MSPHRRPYSRAADGRTHGPAVRHSAEQTAPQRTGGHARPGGHTSLELAKWVALAAMIVDHYGKIVAPDLYAPTHAVGRLSFPLFAAIVGIRLALSPEIAGRYLRRLLPWAIISQPAFAVAGRDWSEGNILFTLALGVWSVQAVRTFRDGRSVLALAAAVLCGGLSAFVEYGPVGVASIPAISLLAARRQRLTIIGIGPLGLLANVRLVPPYLSPLDATALAASGVAHASLAMPVTLPRLPTHVFYALYPLHLLVLHWLDILS